MFLSAYYIYPDLVTSHHTEYLIIDLVSFEKKWSGIEEFHYDKPC